MVGCVSPCLTTIALQMVAGVASTSRWLDGQNRPAEEGKVPALEGVESFWNVP
jgi:hypothetical protein